MFSEQNTLDMIINHMKKGYSEWVVGYREVLNAGRSLGLPMSVWGSYEKYIDLTWALLVVSYYLPYSIYGGIWLHLYSSFRLKQAWYSLAFSELGKLLFMGILPNDKRMGIWLISPLFLVIILRSFCGDTWKEHGYHLNILYDHFAMLFNSTFDFSLWIDGLCKIG